MNECFISRSAGRDWRYPVPTALRVFQHDGRCEPERVAACRQSRKAVPCGPQVL